MDTDTLNHKASIAVLCESDKQHVAPIPASQRELCIIATLISDMKKNGSGTALVDTLQRAHNILTHHAEMSS